jgi:hypothetical protein
MRVVRKTGLVLVAVCVMGFALSASASASMFSSTEAGKITAKALETQTFTTSAGVVTCTTVAASGEVGRLSEDVHVTIHYSGCKAFGLAATVSLALYLFLASGEVHIVNPITVNAGAGSCLVLVPPQLDWTVKYSNQAAGVILTPEVKGIKYTTEGNGCAVKGTFANGEYKGKSLVSLANGIGIVKWEA